MQYVYEGFLREDSHWPNGVIYYGPNCKAKENAITDLIKFLEKEGWDIKRSPIFDESKAEPTIERGNYCYNYARQLIDTFIEAEENYQNTGKRTAVVVRKLDTFTEPRQAPEGENGIYRAKSEFVDEMLATIEKLRQNGCTWITDCESLGNIDSALGRTGRIDLKVPIRSLQEDSKKIWEEYLSTSYNAYQWVTGRHKVLKSCPTAGFINWRLQNAVETYPERYRESSELYQKLKDTKYYPFEI